jgi:hypothetical protein
MTVSQAELQALLQRLTALSENKRITWRRISDDVVQYPLPDFVVELVRVTARNFRLTVTTSDDLPEGALGDAELTGSEAALVRRDLGYLFDLAFESSVSDTASRLLAQLPED